MEKAWLIESENGMYICVNKKAYKTPRIGWTGSHREALRFAREDDAKDFMTTLYGWGLAMHGESKGATEHVWDNAPAPFGIGVEVSVGQREFAERMR